MPELAQVQKQKTAGFVDSTPGRARRRARLDKEEQELKELERQFYSSGDDDNEAESETPEEDAVETVETKKVVSTKENVEEAEDTEQDDQSLSAEEQTFKKRYGDLRRHFDETKNSLTKKINELESQLNSTGDTSMPLDEDQLKAWIEQNPDAAAIVESIAYKKAEEKFAKADERLKDIDREREEIKRAKAEDAIRKAHPDFDDLRADDKFHTWAEEQSKWVQDVLYENQDDAKAVISVLNLYKVDTGQTVSAKKERAKSAATEVNPRSGQTKISTDDKPSFSESQIKKNSDKWFLDNEKAIVEAMREGRFNYDLTGGAR
jgi:hypothetical protein